MVQNDLGTAKLRLKSVPNVETGRLLARLGHLHGQFHTPEGLHGFDGPRRSLVDNGTIMMAIAKELRGRDVHSNIDCEWCGT